MRTPSAASPESERKRSASAGHIEGVGEQAERQMEHPYHHYLVFQIVTFVEIRRLALTSVEIEMQCSEWLFIGELFVFEAWRSFVDKGIHSFLLILGGKSTLKQSSFK